MNIFLCKIKKDVVTLEWLKKYFGSSTNVARIIMNLSCYHSSRDNKGDGFSRTL